MSKTLSKDIAKFETLVRGRSYDECINVLQTILNTIESGKEGFGGAVTACPIEAETEATRFASAVTQLLIDPEYKLNQRAFGVFARSKRALVQSFEVSGYRGTGHLVTMMGKENEDGTRTLASYETPKLLAGLSINNLMPSLLGLLLKQKAEIALSLIMGFLSEQLTYSPIAENARKAIFDNYHLWMDAKITDNMARNMGPSYMGISYAEADNKHDLKKCYNAVLRKWMETKEVTDIDLSEPRRAVKRQPTIVVLAELYDSKHAMHRCYGPSIRALKGRFKTILMTSDGKVDPALTDMFDKTDNTPFDVNNPKAYIDKVKSYRPDIVYFPSIGMRMMSIVCSNVRMAPIQVMTFGHPATTHSDKVDYAILVDNQIGSVGTVSETILFRPTKARWHMRSDAKIPEAQIRRNSEKVSVAVPAWSRKVTPQFLAVCAQIQKQAKNKVEFVFFPNGIGALFQSFKRRVENMLGATVLPRTGYNDYIKNLNKCDIFLSTFPFGATNGIIDAALLGLPVVNLIGDEVHAKNDSDIVAKFDQPDWLSTTSVQAYIEAVVRLVDNHDLRVQISNDILACDPASRLLISDEDDGPQDFVSIMGAAYQHHEEIIATGNAAWNYATLMVLDSKERKSL